MLWWLFEGAKWLWNQTAIPRERAEDDDDEEVDDLEDDLDSHF